MYQMFTADLGWRSLVRLAIAGLLLNPVSALVARVHGAETARMTLEQCLDIALEKNHERPASRFAIAAAEAQHRQALSAYWPQVVGRVGYQRMDEAPNFVFPSTRMYVPPQTINVLGGTAMVTVPAGVLGPAEVQLPVAFPGQTIDTPAGAFTVPEQDVKLMEPDTLTASLGATWLLWDGGMRRGLREQTRAGIAAAREEARRTDLEIHDAVRRMYYGAVVARQLHQIGMETLARLESTLTLTETMYKEGSGKVKKTDYLDNKSTVESLRAMVALLEKNEAMTRAALANTMGLSWRESVTPADDEIPFKPIPGDLEQMVSAAYEFSPDWKKLESGLKAAAGATRTARSGYYPKLAVTGELHKWWNAYDAGIATDRNKEGWTAGVGVEIPLFEGFLTRAKVQEALARTSRLEEQRILLQDGLGLMIKDIFLSIAAAQRSFEATRDAMKTSTENRELNIRAYQNELVDTEKVIRAQLIEAFMTAQHLKTRYDHAALQSRLGLVVGTGVWQTMRNR